MAAQKLLSSIFSSVSKVEKEENVEHKFAICLFGHACIVFNYCSFFFWNFRPEWMDSSKSSMKIYFNYSCF
jgi:hypothetical protein